MIYFAGFIACSSDMKRSSVLASEAVPASEAGSLSAGSVQLLWFLLPAMASLMLLATTNLMCQEIAVVPLLWVLPLSLYLMSFILCFDNQKWYRREIFQVLLAASLPLALLALLTSINAPGLRQISILSLVLFACCMVCHGELVRLKPHPNYLTRFYLLISAGGAAGGIFIALIAPQIFSGFWEFQLGLLGCVLLAMVAVARPSILVVLESALSWRHDCSWVVPRAGILSSLRRPRCDSRYDVSVALLPAAHRTGCRRRISHSNERKASAGISASQQCSIGFEIIVLATLGAALYAQMQFDKYLSIRRDRNFYAALMLKQKGNPPHSIERDASMARPSRLPVI